MILATSIAFVLERRNEKTFQSLNVANDDTLVKVIRNNNVCQVPRKDIVVGDIVLLRLVRKYLQIVNFAKFESQCE